MPLYRDGTVSLTLGSPTVVGVGTAFHENAGPGDLLIVGLDLYEVLSVQGDLALTLSGPAKADYTGTAYTLAKGLLSENVLYLMRKIEEFLSDRQRSTGSFDVWVNGLAGGGDGEGRYPLVDRYGVTRMVKSPLQLEADGTSLTSDLQAALDEAILKLAQLGDFEAGVEAVAVSAAVAVAAKDAAALSAANALTSQGVSEDSANAAALSFVAADAAETAARAAQLVTETARDIALAARAEAEASKVAAEAARVVAVAKASEASASEASALAARIAAEAAEEAAEIAQVAAEAARAEAALFASAAAASEASAANSQGAASTSETNAHASELAAAAAATAALLSQNAGAVSEAASASAAEVALISQNAAAASEGAAAGSEAAAAAAAFFASNAEVAAKAARDAALLSENEAEASALVALDADAAATAAKVAAATSEANAAAHAAATSSDANTSAAKASEAAASAAAAAASAQQAAELVLGEVFDDTQTSQLSGWTSAKIHSEIASQVGAVPNVTPTSDGLMATGDKVKLDGVADGATANDTDEALRSRSSHTGVQSINTIEGLAEALAAAGPVKTVAGVSPGSDGAVPLTAEDVGADAAGTAEEMVAMLADGLAAIAMSGSWNDVEGKPLVIGAGPTQQAAREALGLGSVNDVGAASLRDRSTHTGEQSIGTITGLQVALDATAASSEVGTLDLLTTTAKSTVVDAINEVNGKTGGTGVVYRPIVVQEKSAAIAASNIDFSVAAAQTKTITAATTFTVSNAPPAGMVGCAILDLTNGGAFTLTFPAGSKWAAGTKPTFTAAGRDKLAVMTIDGGVTLDWMLLAGDIK